MEDSRIIKIEDVNAESERCQPPETFRKFWNS